VSHVDLPKERVGFTHPLQHRDGGKPEYNRRAESPPGSQTERQTDRNQNRGENQFTIAAENLIGRFAD